MQSTPLANHRSLTTPTPMRGKYPRPNRNTAILLTKKLPMSGGLPVVPATLWGGLLTVPPTYRGKF